MTALLTAVGLAVFLWRLTWMSGLWWLRALSFVPPLVGAAHAVNAIVAPDHLLITRATVSAASLGTAGFVVVAMVIFVVLSVVRRRFCKGQRSERHVGGTARRDDAA